MPDSIDWSSNLIGIVRAVLLLIAANGAPVIAAKLWDQRYGRPLDNGLRLRDGRRLFGGSKTWRGLYSSICVTGIVAAALDIEAWIGALFGALAMAGDLTASFSKRRLGKIESSRARGFDTVPESLLPLVVLKAPLALGFTDILVSAVIFFLIEEFLSPILYKLRLRKRPY